MKPSKALLLVPKILLIVFCIVMFIASPVYGAIAGFSIWAIWNIIRLVIEGAKIGFATSRKKQD